MSWAVLSLFTSEKYKNNSPKRFIFFECFFFFNRQNKLFWYRLEGSHSTHSDNQLVISNSFLFRKVSSKKIKCWDTNSARRVIFPSWKYRNVTDRSSSPGNYPTLKKNNTKRWKEFQEEREKGTYYNGSHFGKKSCTRWPLTAWAWLVNFRLYWYETAIFYFPWDERFIPLTLSGVY